MREEQKVERKLEIRYWTKVYINLDDNIISNRKTRLLFLASHVGGATSKILQS